MRLLTLILIIIVATELELCAAYYKFERQGIREMLEQRFSSPNKSQRYRFNLRHDQNYCQQENMGRFTTNHHIIPQDWLRSVLSLSFHSEYAISKNLHHTEDLSSQLNTIVNLYHSGPDYVENNVESLDQFTTDFIWDRNNLFCGPPENFRENKPKNSLDDECFLLLNRKEVIKRKEIATKWRCYYVIENLFSSIQKQEINIEETNKQELYQSAYIDISEKCDSKNYLIKQVLSPLSYLKANPSSSTNQLKKAIYKAFRFSNIKQLIIANHSLRPINAEWILNNGNYMVSKCKIDLN